MENLAIIDTFAHTSTSAQSYAILTNDVPVNTYQISFETDTIFNIQFKLLTAAQEQKILTGGIFSNKGQYKINVRTAEQGKIIICASIGKITDYTINNIKIYKVE